MQLTVKMGATVLAILEGHGHKNGFPIPEGSTIELTSNNPVVATVPASVAVPPGGAQRLDAMVTIVGVGTTDISHKTTTPDGTVYEDTATLLVEEVQDGLLFVTITLLEVHPVIA